MIRPFIGNKGNQNKHHLFFLISFLPFVLLGRCQPCKSASHTSAPLCRQAVFLLLFFSSLEKKKTERLPAPCDTVGCTSVLWVSVCWGEVWRRELKVGSLCGSGTSCSFQRNLAGSNKRRENKREPERGGGVLISHLPPT